LFTKLDTLERFKNAFACFMDWTGGRIVHSQLGYKTFPRRIMWERRSMTRDENTKRLHQVKTVGRCSDSFAFGRDFFARPHPNLLHWMWQFRSLPPAAVTNS
jgi:hypothetical protein